jgi:hypothetical protein
MRIESVGAPGGGVASVSSSLPIYPAWPFASATRFCTCQRVKRIADGVPVSATTGVAELKPSITATPPLASLAIESSRPAAWVVLTACAHPFKGAARSVASETMLSSRRSTSITRRV